MGLSGYPSVGRGGTAIGAEPKTRPAQIDAQPEDPFPGPGQAPFQLFAHARIVSRPRWITPWPRTEWTVRPAETMPAPPDRVLVGEGPAFLNFEAAFSSFFYGKPPGNFTGQGNVWRISRLDRRGWLNRVTISPDALDISVRGTQLAGAVVELSSPADSMTRRAGRTGKVRLRHPAGLADGSLLLLRSDDDWLDYRYSHAPVPGRQQDPSVAWDQPGAHRVSSGRLHRDALVADEGEPQISIRAISPRMGLFARVAPRLLPALPVKTRVALYFGLA